MLRGQQPDLYCRVRSLLRSENELPTCSRTNLQSLIHILLALIFHELLSRDHEDGRATGQPQGAGLEAYLNGTSQGAAPEDARKNEHIRGRSR